MEDRARRPVGEVGRRQKDMLRIGDFSKLSIVSIRMLRRYDEVGLLRPAETDDLTGYRHYREDQLPRAQRIAALRDMGFGLADIAVMLETWDDGDVRRARFEAMLSRTHAEIDGAEQRVRLLRSALEQLRREGTTMEYDVTLKELPVRSVASVRRVIHSYADEQSLWDTYMRETEKLSLRPAAPYALSVFHDREYKECDVDVEVQMCVEGSYADTEHVRFKTVPAVQYASATYKGSYEMLGGVNQAVANWVCDNGYEFDGPMFCIYHVSPHETNDPNEYVTEICYPVKKF